jgi:sugar lactone lactonase YvrE
MAVKLEVTDLAAVGRGIERPEQVLVTREGDVYASDKGSAVAQIQSEGGLRRIGRAGGEPNGIALTADGRFVIANFGLGELQELDPVAEELRVLASGEVAGLPLTWINCPVVDSAGHIWVSVCSTNPDLSKTIGLGTADGYLFFLENRPGAVPKVVANGVNFPNCMALDQDEEYLYVVRTTLADVVRFRIVDGGLGEMEVYSQPMGARRQDEFGEDALGLYAADPEVGKRWGMADGCAFDADGNLWVTLVGPNRVVAVAPSGEVTTIIEDPDGSLIDSPTSVAWGGPDMRDVYIGSLATSYVLKGRSSVPGMRMVHQR